MIPVRPFFMIRHGETVANAEGYVAGSLDTPLTEKGRRQAFQARLCFERLPSIPQRIVHSSLSRARDTAQIMNENLGLPLVEVAGLAERSFGDWARRPWKEIACRIDTDDVPPQGESVRVFGQRIEKALIDIFSVCDDKIFIVSHGGVFHALARLYGHALVEDVKNCELYSFAPCDEGGGFPWRILNYRLTSEGALVSLPVAVKPI